MRSHVKELVLKGLLWSEKYTKTDMVYLATGSVLSSITQVSVILASLLFAIVVGHFLPKEVYGEYKYVLSIVALLSLLSLNNIGGAVLQSTAEGYEGTLQKGFWASLRWSVLIFVAALLLASYYFLLHNVRLGEEILIGGCFSPFMASASLFSPFLAGKKDFLRQQIYSIFDNIIPIGIMILAVIATHDALILIAVYFVSNTLAGIFFYNRTVRAYNIRSNKTDKGMLTYGKHLSAMGILGGIADNIDKILVFHFVGAVPLAVYSFATALPDQARTPLKTIDAMVQTRFAKRSTEEIRYSMGNKIIWYLLFAIVVISIYILLAPFLYKIFFPAYTNSILYSQIYIISLLGIVSDPAASYLASRRKVKEAYIDTVFFSTCQIITMFIGVIWWGILGLIIAQVITRLVNSLLIYTLYRLAIKKEIPYV